MVEGFSIPAKKFMKLQFFFLEQMQYDFNMCSQQIAAIRGMFGSMTTGKDWVSEVMVVLNEDQPGMSLLDLVVIIEMSVWWQELQPGHSVQPIVDFFYSYVYRMAEVIGVSSYVFSIIIGFARRK